MTYEPLKISLLDVSRVGTALKAMRLPKTQKTESTRHDDLKLASKLIRAGADHGKFARGIVAWYQMECQVGWLIEYVTYRIGIECLSSSSSMHGELRELTGADLADKKQDDLPNKVYTRIEMASYQALRRVYMARRHHRHPDWQVFCQWIEKLPYFKQLIYPEGK